MDAYENEYRSFKRGRKLQWLSHLGSVTLELESEEEVDEDGEKEEGGDKEEGGEGDEGGGEDDGAEGAEGSEGAEGGQMLREKRSPPEISPDGIETSEERELLLSPLSC